MKVAETEEEKAHPRTERAWTEKRATYKSLRGNHVWEWSVRLGIGCVWEVDLITAELLLGGCSREERAEVAVIQPPPGEEG